MSFLIVKSLIREFVKDLYEICAIESHFKSSQKFEFFCNSSNNVKGKLNYESGATLAPVMSKECNKCEDEYER